MANAVIFCNRKRDISTLKTSLERNGFDALALHGDMTQSARNDALAKFKNGDVPLLVASDVAARGIDIAGLSHVFNFDVPNNPEDYVHRIGRTGRAGKSGRAFTLVANDDDSKAITGIEKLIGKTITSLDDGAAAKSAPAVAANNDEPPSVIKNSVTRPKAAINPAVATAKMNCPPRLIVAVTAFAKLITFPHS